MPLQAQHRFSVKDYYRMAETGVRRSDARVFVELDPATIEVYREPHFTGYANQTILRAGDLARPWVFPGAVANAGESLKR